MGWGGGGDPEAKVPGPLFMEQIAIMSFIRSRNYGRTER